MSDDELIALGRSLDILANRHDLFALCRAVERAAYLRAATACTQVWYGIDSDEFSVMTKKQHAERACHECADAIRALIDRAAKRGEG